MRSPDSSLTILAVLSAFAAAVMFAATTVTVDDGDTLGAIAAAQGVTVAELVEWNAIDDPDRIFAGDLLVVSAPPTGASSHATTSDTETHTVTAGETLSLIAARYGASVAALAEANGIEDPDRIQEGAVLVFDATASPAEDEPAAPDEPATTHVVLPGDTLWSIAATHGVSVGHLVAANDLSDENHIITGQTLSIAPAPEPSSESAEPAPTTTTSIAPTTTTTPSDEPADEPDAETADAEADQEEANEDTSSAVPVIPRPSVTQTPLADAFERWATSYGVPQDLLEAIAWHASDWQPAITGPDGRLGITQLTPEVVELVETRLLGLELDPLATSDGVRLAARYLRYLLDRTHDDREALIAWQIGLSAVLDGQSDAAAETWADTVLEIRRMRA